MADYKSLPKNASLKATSYRLHIDDQKIEDMKTLIRLSPLGPETYENQQDSPDRRFGINVNWMKNAKDSWQNHYDWFVVYALLPDRKWTLSECRGSF